MVIITCPSRYKISRPRIKKVVEEIFIKERIPNDYNLNLIFIGRNKMKAIAAKYKNEDVALPVLSFAYSHEKDNLLGEIFICYPQAVLLAAEREKKVNQTLDWLIEHGINNIINK